MASAMTPADVRRGCALPQGWAAPVEFSETVDLSGCRIALSGFSSVGPRGENVSGSAASAEGAEPPAARSYCELLERVSVVSAMNGGAEELDLLDRDGERVGRVPRGAVFPASDRPERWRPSISNGVALHTTWREACDRAADEIVERDRVLRSWYGESQPRRRPLPTAAIPEALRRLADWRAYDLPPSATAVGGCRSVALVLGAPIAETTPLTCGFAARADADRAIEAAAAEAVQRFSFLFGEEIPAAAPEHSPTPDFHQEFYLHPPARPLLEAWLDGDQTSTEAREPDARGWPLEGASAPLFVDLTPSHLRGAVFVAKAIWPGAEPLVFGDPAPHRAGVRAPRRVHPIA
jgi:YcaO cyclodehydratase, ATP-ad Mg2+-binding